MIDNFSGKYFFLSNFFYFPFIWNNKEWKTIEHAFQAAKTKNIFKQEEIRNAETPGEAKRLGRKLTLRNDWEKIKFNIMEELVLAKFLNEKLLNKLIKTGKEELIEGNNWNDKIWGMVKNEDGEYEGKNNLGKIIMKVRKYYNEKICNSR